MPPNEAGSLQFADGSTNGVFWSRRVADDILGRRPVSEREAHDHRRLVPEQSVIAFDRCVKRIGVAVADHRQPQPDPIASSMLQRHGPEFLSLTAGTGLLP